MEETNTNEKAIVDDDAFVQREDASHDEEKPVKDYNNLTNFICGALLGLLMGFLLFYIITPTNNLDNPYVSNLTNASLVKGYVVGFNTCQDRIVQLVNVSNEECKPIYFNFSDVVSELIPRHCIGK